MTDSRNYGTVVHLIDVDKATAFIKDKIGDPTFDIHAELMAIVNGEEGLATVITEGVGWFADKDGGIPINYWGINGRNGYIDITVDELKTLISDKTIDLADHIRSFGHRLESNFYSWYSYAKGYPQDKESLLTAKERAMAY